MDSSCLDYKLKDGFILRDLIGRKNDNGVIATEDLLIKSLNNRLAKLKNTLSKNKSTDRRLVDADLTEKYFTSENVFKSMNSVKGIKKFEENIALQEYQEKKKTEVKFDDVRKMVLGISSLDGFEDAEKEIIQRRLQELSEDFNLEKSTDKFLAWRVAVCELKILQLETWAAMNPKVAKEIRQDVDVLDKQYKVFCESLNALKRQRDNNKNNKPVDDTGDLTDMIKSVDEMQKEVEKKQKEIFKKKTAKYKNN